MTVTPAWYWLLSCPCRLAAVGSGQLDETSRIDRVRLSLTTS